VFTTWGLDETIEHVVADQGHQTLTLVAQLARRDVTSPLPARYLVDDDRPGLARAMLEAYRGGFDEPEMTMSKVEGCLWKFFDSGIATPLLDCSFVALDEGRIVAATQVCLDDGRPLLARAYTVPSWQNRGLARGLIQLSQNALLERGERVLALMVKSGNLPARHLYESMEFVFERGRT
jgi:GNAT superfamily N-acetyltransferase